MGGRCIVVMPPVFHSGQQSLQPGPFTCGTSPVGAPGSFMPRCHVTVGRLAKETVPVGAVTIGPSCADATTAPASSSLSKVRQFSSVPQPMYSFGSGSAVVLPQPARRRNNIKRMQSSYRTSYATVSSTRGPSCWIPLTHDASGTCAPSLTSRLRHAATSAGEAYSVVPPELGDAWPLASASASAHFTSAPSCSAPHAYGCSCTIAELTTDEPTR